jgi:hypothetical protein
MCLCVKKCRVTYVEPRKTGVQKKRKYFLYVVNQFLLNSKIGAKVVFSGEK